MACRSLGYSAGAQMLVGEFSPFPAAVTVPRLIRAIVCEGSEETLSECDIRLRTVDYQEVSEEDVVPGAIALVCTTSSGALTDTWSLLIPPTFSSTTVI